MKANYKVIKSAYEKALAERDAATMEEVYAVIDEKMHKLYHKDDTGTVPQDLLQKWEELHGFVCSAVMEFRMHHPR